MVYMELRLCGSIDFVQDNGDGGVKLLDWKQSAKDLIVNARAFEYYCALGMSATSGSKYEPSVEHLPRDVQETVQEARS